MIVMKTKQIYRHDTTEQSVKNQYIIIIIFFLRRKSWITDNLAPFLLS